MSQQQPNWVLGGFFLGVSCISSSIWNIAQTTNAIHGTVFQKTALTWCRHKKGPVFVAMFKPTIMVIAVVFELIFLSNALVIGGTIIGFGFYTMMWGQAKEDNVCATWESSAPNTPLLQNCVGWLAPGAAWLNPVWCRVNRLVVSSGCNYESNKQYMIDCYFQTPAKVVGRKRSKLSDDYLQMGGGFCLDEYGANKGTDKCPSNSAVDPAHCSNVGERVTEMMGLQSCMKKELPFAVIVMLEFGDICSTTLSKAAMNVGMNSLIFVVYHNALGTVILLPFFIFHRHRICLTQICVFTRINYSSPTLSAAVSNILPAFTFLLAIIFRMEKFDLRRPRSQAKSLGTIVAVSRAFVMALYKGAIYGTVFRSTALTWCLHKKGPVYVVMFKPTLMIIAVVFELIFLGTIIAFGFYTMMWGKAKEEDRWSALGERFTEMMGLQSWMKKELPFAVMVMLEFGDVCTKTLTKAAMNTGMNSLVFVVYHNALGTLILLPLFIFHRHSRTQQPPLSFSLLCRFSLLGLLGTCLLQICLFTGINYSSPTLAAALGNLFPAFTFLLAVLFRMEKIDLRKPSRQAKSLGTIVAVLGAFVMTLYKGPPLLVAILPSNLPHRLLLSQEQPNWVLGGLFLGISCLSSSIWNIVQTATIKEYPDEITVAIYGTVFRTNALTWCLHKKGPVYVAMFKPTNDYCSGL
ncbi:unnamed protein product [Camellia sinensis]